MRGRVNHIRIGALLAIAVILSYLIPVLFHIRDIDTAPFFNDQDGLNSAWARSLELALASTLINILLSLGIAVSLKPVRINSFKGNLMAILLLPVLLGNVSVAFTGKLLFTNAAIIQASTSGKLLMLLLIQFWQYGTLYVYLFWLLIQSVPGNTAAYAAAIRLTRGEYAKDILLPACRNLGVLLFMINFSFTFYEDAKASIIFKFSRGTDTELISQWLNRNYLAGSLLDQRFSVQQTTGISLVVIGSALLLLLLAGGTFIIVYGWLTGQRKPMLPLGAMGGGRLIFYPLLLFVALPLLLALVDAFGPLVFDLRPLLFPFCLTALAALIATLAAIILGALLRLGWKRVLYRFDRRSLLFFILFFTVELIPPLLLLICGYQWLKWTGYADKNMVCVIWVAGHVLLSLPLISSFLAVTHFRTLNRELDFFEAHHAGFGEVLKTGFLRRYPADYMLSFLIAFSLIWNESIINNILSDYVPSFVSNITMAIEGRAADFSRGVSYLLVSLLIALLSLAVWFLVLAKIKKNNAIDPV
jgi:hypothetical protein